MLRIETTAAAKVGIARWSEAEDPQTRTMRTEIDVPNPDGRLRHGMYGRVTLTLAEGTPGCSFELASTKTTPSGLLLNTYKLAGPLQAA